MAKHGKIVGDQVGLKSAAMDPGSKDYCTGDGHGLVAAKQWGKAAGGGSLASKPANFGAKG